MNQFEFVNINQLLAMKHEKQNLQDADLNSLPEYIPKEKSCDSKQENVGNIIQINFLISFFAFIILSIF